MTDVATPDAPSQGADAPPAAHLIDPCCAGHLAVAALRATARSDDITIVIGPTRAGDAALMGGVHAHARIGAPLGKTELAWRAIRRRAAEFVRRGGAILAWSPGAAAAARLAFPRAPVAACVLEAELGSFDATSRLRRAMVRSLADGAVFGSPAQAASWGVHGARVATPPVPRAAPLDADARRATRERWGFDDDAPVVALLGDPPLPLDARRAMFLVGVLAIAGTPVHGVAPHDATGVERARRLIERQRGPWSVGVDDRPPDHWLGACDAAIAFAGRDGGEPLAALWGARSGLPIIVEREGAQRASWREDGALIVPRGAVNLTASRLLDIIERRPIVGVEGERPTSPTNEAEVIATWRAEVAAALRSAVGREAGWRATAGSRGAKDRARALTRAVASWAAPAARS